MTSYTKEGLIADFANQLKLGKASLFIGSGISRKSGYSGWKDCLKDAATEIDLDVDKEKDLITLAEYYILEKQRTRINQAIKSFFADSQGEPQEVHKIIASLPINEIWTTNYDTLIERSFKDENVSTTVITNDKSYQEIEPEAKVKVYKIHGDVATTSKCVITRSDYENFEAEHDIVLAELKAAMCSKSFLFLGYSFSDTDIQHILSKIRLTYNRAHPQRHYCVVKNVAREDFATQEKYEYAKKKQRHYVNDMQSYGINVLLIDSFNEIEPLLVEIRNKVYSKNVLVSGSYELDDSLAQIRISPVAQKISIGLIEKGYKIYSGYGKNLGADVVSGAFEGCTKKGKKAADFSENVFLYPFPFRKQVRQPMKELYTRIRESMISRTRICIIIAGKKKNGNSTINADGVYEEYLIAKAQGDLIIPLSSTGGVAMRVWDELNTEEKYAHSEKFEKLKTITNPEELANLVLDIIENNY